MPDLTVAALHRLAAQHGVATSRQLAFLGVGAARRHRLVGCGVLTHVHKSVYRLAGTPPTLAQRCAALCLAHPSCFVTGPTAGQLLGLRRMPPTASVHVAVPHGVHLERLAGVRWRQTTAIHRADVDRRADGIAVASWARLAFDLAADLSALDHRSVVEQLLHERRCTTEELAAVAARLVHPNRRGSRRFLESIGRGDGPASESHPEVVLADRLRAAGIPVVAQVDSLALPDGRRIRLDLAVPELRWGIEVDVHPEHLGAAGTTSDKRRDRQCHLIGWEIERVTSTDLDDLDGLVDELVRLYHGRRRGRTA